jgi:hypothetical protein
MTKLQEKPSALKREHPALKKIKFINFFLYLWEFLSSGYGSRDPIESGSNLDTVSDPDPQHCLHIKDCLLCN